MNGIIFTKSSYSPLRVVTELAVAMITIEFIIMMAIEYLLKPMMGKNVPDAFWNFADPIFLVIFLIPYLYFLVMRPMKAQQQQLMRQKVELEKAVDKLLIDEAQVLASHQKILETRERMIQIEKLSSLGTMVGGVAHEINNPLMGILNYVEYAREKATDKKSIEVLDDALKEINRIKKIVSNMLIFVRTDSSKQESCSIQETVKRTLSLLEIELKINAVQVQVNLPGNLPMVKCSEGSLQQVLLNLLLNARDAIAEQEEKRITITGQNDNKKIILSICDNGPGIPVEALEKIFDPFFTTKPVGKGTGLGLSVTRHLLEEVGGSISLNKVPGYGCCFTLEFNAA